MSLETDLFAALRGLVSDRVYPQVFPQPKTGLPTWPAIRYSILNTTPVQDLCGDGEDETADSLVQLDAVAETYSGMRSLRLQIMAALKNMPTARLQTSFDDYDEETKTHRAMLRYEFYGSSEGDSP